MFEHFSNSADCKLAIQQSATLRYLGDKATEVAPLCRPARKHSLSAQVRLATIVTSLTDWFAEHHRDLPWRHTLDPYAIWISEIMLQQTQVKTVVPFWTRWMRELPTIKALAKADSQRVHKLWEGLGYYTRARNLQKAAQTLVLTHGREFPETFTEVLALPGIGRYTAGAICSIAFNQPTPILDGNVIRVLTRLFGISGNPRETKTNLRLWNIAEQLVRVASTSPKSKLPRGCSTLNQSLMELGALLCTPRQPQCGSCPVSICCVALRRRWVDRLPNMLRRAQPIPRRFVAFVAQKRERFLVRQRPTGVVNGQMWEFPNVEIVTGDSNIETLAREFFGVSRAEIEPMCTIKHSITRYRITLEVVLVINYARTLRLPEGRWLNRRQLKLLPFPSAHKRILDRLSERRSPTRRGPDGSTNTPGRRPALRPALR